MEKPRVKLVGEDGNVFNLIAICSKALKEAGQHENAKEMQNKIFRCGSYHEAFVIIMDYCKVAFWD